LPAGPDAIWQRWKQFALRVASVQVRILLALVYATVLLPFALILRLTSNPFRGSGWHAHEGSDSPRRQF
jgi:hypothetical protein